MAIDYELTSLQTKKTQQNCNLQKNTYPITAKYYTHPWGNTHQEPTLVARSHLQHGLLDGPRVIVLDKFIVPLSLLCNITVGSGKTENSDHTTIIPIRDFGTIL